MNRYLLNQAYIEVEFLKETEHGRKMCIVHVHGKQHKITVDFLHVIASPAP